MLQRGLRGQWLTLRDEPGGRLRDEEQEQDAQRREHAAEPRQSAPAHGLEVSAYTKLPLTAT